MKAEEYQGLEQTDDSPEGLLLDQLVAEAVEYVHVKARDQVVDALRKTDNTAATMGAITYKMSRGLLEKHRERGLNFDIDMNLAMGLATETIDMLGEVVERVNPNAAMNLDKVKEDALLHTVALHGEQLDKEDNPEVRAQAKAAMRGYMQDGSVDAAFGYMNQRASVEGLNTNDMMRQGGEMAKASMGKQAQRHPIAAGVEQGLSGAQAPPLMGG